MLVRFLADFDFSPAARRGMVTIAYRAGTEMKVTRECARAAIAAGKAEKMPPQQGRKRKNGGKDGEADGR